MPSPLLSIVVPFYKVERYLHECLASIESQTLRDLECIVIDDGSPDNGHLIAEEFVQRDPRFRLVRSQNQGLGPARNLGAGLAEGKYLTFVDSDDIVPPRAYSLMTATLEETGSAFAAGNARRFDGPEGVTQSWTHAGPFAATQLGTHINAFPDLVRDRMAWNKVYRRDFWESEGLTFPPIRYEDYPVSMQAHLSAPAVDIVSEHIYYWRQRGTGDSITQSLFEPDNLADRARSAHLTLDTVERLGVPSLVSLAHEYFIDIDLVVFAQAVVHSSPESHAQAVSLGRELAARLQLQQRSSNALGDVIHESFRRGDLAMVRAMARWRDGDGIAGLRAELPLVPRPRQAGPLLRRAAPSRKLASPLAPRRLRSHLTSMRTERERTRLVVDVRLRPALAHRATAEVFLESPGSSTPVTASQEETGSGLRLTITVDAAELDGIEKPWTEAELRIRLHVAALTWLGSVDANPALLSGPALTEHCAFQWAAPLGHRLQVHRLGRVHTAEVSTEGDDFVLTHAHLNDPTIAVLRPYPTDDVVMSTSGTRSRVSATELLADPPDEPVIGIAERRVVLQRRAACDELLLVGESAVIVHGDRQVSLARDGWGFLVIRHGPVGLDQEMSAALAAGVLDADAEGGQVPPELGGSMTPDAEDEVTPPVRPEGREESR